MLRPGVVVLAGASVLASVALLGAGCSFLQGGTDGYTVAEASAGAGGSCTASSQCGAGQACCYELEGGTVTPSCQSSCVAPWAESCGQALDCGDGGECLAQQCTIEAGVTVSLTVSTCAPIPFCVQ